MNHKPNPQTPLSIMNSALLNSVCYTCMWTVASDVANMYEVITGNEQYVGVINMHMLFWCFQIISEDDVFVCLVHMAIDITVADIPCVRVTVLSLS